LIAERAEDWRGAAAFINRRDDRLPLLVCAGLIEAEAYASSSDPVLQDFCLLPVLGIYRIDERRRFIAPVTLSEHSPTPEQCQSAMAHGGTWLLVRCLPQDAPSLLEKIRRRLARCAGRARILETQAFGGVTAARVDL
jgi:hypothetical protein